MISAVGLSYVAFIMLRKFPLCSLAVLPFIINGVLNFGKSLFIYWDGCIIFILQFVDVAYHTDWFVDIEESLNPWDESHLIMVYDPFNVLLDSTDQ